MATNMRFTQGYWVIRQDYVMSYATQTVRVIKSDKELHIISACRPKMCIRDSSKSSSFALCPAISMKSTGAKTRSSARLMLSLIHISQN